MTIEIEKLRTMYEIAKSNGWKSFYYEGHEILTAYAKWVLEYVDKSIHQSLLNLN